MRRLTGILLSAILVFGSGIIVLGQEGRGQGRIFGIVTDEAGNPVAKAEITCESLQFDFSKKTTSNKKGNWAIAGLGPGMFRIRAEKEGFLPSETQMMVSHFRNPAIDFVLKTAVSADVQTIEGGEASKQDFRDALSFYRQKNYRAALELFLSFREKNPTLFQIGINIGNCYRELGEYEKAIEEYESVLAMLKAENPDLAGNEDAAKALTNIGETYLLRDEMEKGQPYLEEALAIFPNDHALAFNVAEIYFNGGQIEKAIEYYNLAIQIKPDWPLAYQKIGYAFLNKADYKGAVNSFKKFLELAPEDPAADTIRDLIPKLEKMK